MDVKIRKQFRHLFTLHEVQFHLPTFPPFHPDVHMERQDVKTYSPAFVNAMADLMGLPKVRLALQGNQLTAQERQRLNSYARFCLKFQSNDLTKEVR